MKFFFNTEVKIASSNVGTTRLQTLYSLRFLEGHPEGMAKETVFIGTRFLGLELLLHLKNYNVNF